MSTEPWVSVEDVAKHLSVAKDSIYRWIEHKSLPANKLQEVLPALSTKQIQHLLAEMKAVGQAHVVGVTRGAKWYPGSAAEGGGQP